MISNEYIQDYIAHLVDDAVTGHDDELSQFNAKLTNKEKAHLRHKYKTLMHKALRHLLEQNKIEYNASIKGCEYDYTTNIEYIIITTKKFTYRCKHNEFMGILNMMNDKGQLVDVD